MARKNRKSPHIVELNKQLKKAPFSFDFYQAVRLLDCANEGTPATGQSESPREEPFRFSQEPTMVFSPATLSNLEDATRFHPPRLVQRFFGLFGPQGPMPVHLTDYARSRIQHYHDPTFHRFYDLFHHRLLAFFYRAWARVRPTVNLDRGVRDRFGEYVSAFFGLGMEGLVNRDALPDLAKRHYAGLLSCQTKHAEGLLSMLKGYFGLPVELQEFVGQWLPLPDDCTCQLGESAAISTLGETITVGSHIWDCQQKFRVQFGPLDLQDYFHLLPVSIGFLDNRETEEVGADSAPAVARGSRAYAMVEDDPSAPMADTLYYNANFFTGDKQRPWVDAIAVRDGKTMALGSLKELGSVLGDETRIEDLQGSCVIPDLSLEIEANEEGAATPLQRVTVPPCSEDEATDCLFESIREATASVPVGAWLSITGPSSKWLPTLTPDQLDHLAPDHPLVIQFNDDSATLGLNSLARNGLQTPLPPAVTDWYRGESANELLSELDAEHLPAMRTPRTECERSPQPCNHWHVLQALVRKHLREQTSMDQQEVLRQAHAWEGDQPTESEEQRLRRFALIRAIERRAEGLDPTSTPWGLKAELPANMLVLSQDLFQLTDEKAIDQIPDTRLVKAIRRGDVVYDLLRGMATIDESQASFADVREEWSREYGWHLSPQREETEPDSQATAKSDTRPLRDESKTLESLIALVRSYVGDQLQWDVQLILKADETPPLGLGIQGHLGWSTWLLRDGIGEDPRDLILDAMATRGQGGGQVHEYHRLEDWNHSVLGQSREGDLMLARNTPSSPSHDDAPQPAST